MKNLLTSLLLLMTFSAFGQTQYNLAYDTVKVGKTTDSKTNITGKLYLPLVTAGVLYKRSGTALVESKNLGVSDITGLSPLVYVAEPVLVPTSDITGGTTIELYAAGAKISSSVTGYSGRQLYSATIDSIVLAGVNQTFSQPAAPGTVVKTQAILLTRNVDTTIVSHVRLTDGRYANNSTTFAFSPGRYWGYSSAVPVASDILAVLGGAKDLSKTNEKANFYVAISGSNKYVWYAYPSSMGAATSLFINGIESIGAFNQTTVSVTNVNGYTQNYNLVCSAYTYNGQALFINSVQ